MRQKDIIKALQNVSEKSAVQLGEEYHGIADIDHERLLHKVEQRLEIQKEVQDTPESPKVFVPICLPSTSVSVADCRNDCCLLHGRSHGNRYDLAYAENCPHRSTHGNHDASDDHLLSCAAAIYHRNCHNR